MGTLGGGSFSETWEVFCRGMRLMRWSWMTPVCPSPETEVAQRLERFIYLGDEQNIVCKYVNGVCIR